MLGVILGAVFAIGAVKFIRRAMWRRAGYGWGSCSRYGAGGFRRPTLLGWLFERLETTAVQEQAIEGVAARLRKERASIREEIGLTRADIARALESPVVDESALEETFARHDRLLVQLRVAWVEALKSVCETLDQRQRKLLADILLKRGVLGGPWGFGSGFGQAHLGRDEGGGVWA